MEKLKELPKIYDRRGNLSFIEGLNHIPFSIERAYWIYDVPGGQERGSHAFKTQHEFIVALSGSFDVVLNDGEKETRYHLNRSYKGIYIPPMTWRSLDNFSTNSLCLVLSSKKYDPSDYIHEFEDYWKIKKEDVLSFIEKDLSVRELIDASANEVLLNSCLGNLSMHDCKERSEERMVGKGCRSGG